jgi:23S rRNA (cytidine1920-2'-O)/16S rRNA (cytidine1409-2'-O)-methyltransferase
MRADQYLVSHGFFDTRARAQAAIAAGKVRVNGEAVRKASQKIPEGAQVEAEAAHPWVSRAALKLVAGLDAFGIDPAGLVALDVGASTGGFTEVLLEREAAKVYAVDVGREQLHASLRGDGRVVSLEGQDARTLTAAEIPEPPQLVVCDASFISLLKVIPAPLALAAPGARLVALIKPQFEVGRDGIAKGGIVKSAEIRDAAVARVRAAIDALPGWTVTGLADSPIEGGDGNREFLLGALKTADRRQRVLPCRAA